MSKKRVMVIFSLILLVSAFCSFISAVNYAPGEIIVQYKEGVVGNGNSVFVDGGTRLKVYTYVPVPDESEQIVAGKELYTLRFDRAENISEIVEKYKTLSEVAYAEPNYIFESFVVPSDSDYDLQGWMKSIGLEQSWNLTQGNKAVSIAVIDTGVDWNHPDLALNIWNNTDEGCDGAFDLDGNGYFGDCRGYDFVDIDTTLYEEWGYGFEAGEDYTTIDGDPADFNGHGTHVAGIAGGVLDNGVGIAGVCGNCSVMPVRSGFQIKTPSGGMVGSLEIDDVVGAVYYALENNASVISMSFGGGDSQSVHDALIAAYEQGSVLVAASGNSGGNDVQYPCGYDEVICVGATDGVNNPASYSTYGDWVDVAAPGSSIYSTFFDDSYRSLTGTSMATPVVAGSIGLLLSLFDLNHDEVVSVFQTTGLGVNFSGVVIQQINVSGALLSLDEVAPLVTLENPINGTILLSGENNFSCSASDWQLDLLTLTVHNTSGIFYQEMRNVSGVATTQTFSAILSSGDYYWNCVAGDEVGNEGAALSNYSFSVSDPDEVLVSLNSPLNATYTNNSSTDFNCSISSIDDYTTMNFILENSSFVFANVSAAIKEENNFSYSFSEEGTYFWNCAARGVNNSLSGGEFVVSYDATTPVVSLTEPADDVAYTGGRDVSFSFSVSEESFCNLSVGGSVVRSFSLASEGVANIFYDVGNYEWSVSCVDRAGNAGVSSTRNFVINNPVSAAPPSAPSAPASGGGSSGGSSIASSSPSVNLADSKKAVLDTLTKSYMISDQQVVDGYSNQLHAGDDISFKFLEGEELFALRLNEIGAGYADFIIGDQSIILEVGERAKVSLTNEAYYDLAVTLVSLTEKGVEVRLQKINEKIVSEGITGFAVDERGINEGRLYQLLGIIKQKGFNLGGNLVVVGVIIVVVCILFIERRYLEEEIKKLHILGHREKFNTYIKPDQEKVSS